jgi:phosphate transport system substrate-binding protein
VGSAKRVLWPVGVGVNGNEGVAGTLAHVPGAVGYVNQAVVLADARSGAAGLNSVLLDAGLGGSDCNPTGAESFPIVSFTGILAYGSGQGQVRSKARAAVARIRE